MHHSPITLQLDPHQQLPDRTIANLRIPMMVMGDSDLIVMVVSERNDHHDRSEATLTL
jgi:hypothetical protein